MNYLFLFTVTVILFCPHKAYPKECFEIVLRPLWQSLDNDKKSSSLFDSKWVLIGTITFKKKSKDLMALNTIMLQWNGACLDTITTSLYKKPHGKEFAPIEDNIICDGIWNKAKQTIIFNFNEKQTIHPTTTFYLVLTIPTDTEHLFKNSSFSCITQCLPQQFQRTSHIAPLPLLIDER